MLIEAIAREHPTVKDAAATAQQRKDYESKVGCMIPCVCAFNSMDSNLICTRARYRAPGLLNDNDRL